MKTSTDNQIDQLEYELQDLKRKVAELRRRRPSEEIRDYTLFDSDGREAPLSSLFGAHDTLTLVHNMGRGCSHCTMWADGFTGLLPYLESRTAFVLTSPDPPQEQKAFARSRGWNFPVYSTSGTSFTADMGFDHETEGLMPGVSVFTKGAEGTIFRVSRAEFGPGDDFCAVWHFFDLLPEGVANWVPRTNVASARQPAVPSGAACHC